MDRAGSLGQVIVGVIANPVASKDIRRLVSLSRVVDVEEKVNVVARLLAGLAAGPPLEVHALRDHAGIVERAAHLTADRHPPLRWLPVGVVGTEADTRHAAALLQEREAASVVTVGGDGTVRAVVQEWPDAALVPVAAGTNNAIALGHDPTILGLAAAHATAPEVAARAFRVVVRLLADTGDASYTAVVDVVGVRSAWTGARALWVPDELVEAVIGVASPTSVGLASVAAGLGPLPPTAARYVRFGGGTKVRAVFAPGLVIDLEVAEHRLVDVGAPVTFTTSSRALALDGERHVVTSEQSTVTVAPGPRILNPLVALDGGEARS